MTSLAAALAYARQGLAVFPLSPRSKAPFAETRGHLDATTDGLVLARCWPRPDANVGIACYPSRLVGLDVDPRNGGDGSLADLEREHGPLPPTWRALTGGGGLHVMFRAPTDITLIDGPIASGIDLKANGYLVAPPSLHPNGERYAWEIGYEPGTLPLAPLPSWLLQLAQRRTDRLRADGTPLELRDGERNRRLFQLACAWRRYGLGSEALRGCLDAVNRAHAQPPLNADELARVAASAARYAPRATVPENSGGPSHTHKVRVV